MAIAITEEQGVIQQSIADATVRVNPVSAVREGVSGAWRRVWPDFVRLGLFSIAQDGGLDDQSAALEQAADGLVPGPALPTVLASILLARQQEPIAKELLHALADGTATAGVGFGDEAPWTVWTSRVPRPQCTVARPTATGSCPG